MDQWSSRQIEHFSGSSFGARGCSTKEISNPSWWLYDWLFRSVEFSWLILACTRAARGCHFVYGFVYFHENSSSPSRPIPLPIMVLTQHNQSLNYSHYTTCTYIYIITCISNTRTHDYSHNQWSDNPRQLHVIIIRVPQWTIIVSQFSWVMVWSVPQWTCWRGGVDSAHSPPRLHSPQSTWTWTNETMSWEYRRTPLEVVRIYLYPGVCSRCCHGNCVSGGQTLSEIGHHWGEVECVAVGGLGDDSSRVWGCGETWRWRWWECFRRETFPFLDWPLSRESVCQWIEVALISLCLIHSCVCGGGWW